jgi:hypothetical protein
MIAQSFGYMIAQSLCNHQPGLTRSFSSRCCHAAGRDDTPTVGQMLVEDRQLRKRRFLVVYFCREAPEKIFL